MLHIKLKGSTCRTLCKFDHMHTPAIWLGKTVRYLYCGDKYDFNDFSSDSFTILGLGVLGLAGSFTNESN